MQLFVNNLINLDFSYLDVTRGLVGETWIASVTLSGELDEQGMICDFGIVKKILREWLTEEIDHRLLVPSRNNKVTTERVQATPTYMKSPFESGPERLKVTMQSIDEERKIINIAPEAAVTLIEDEVITAESVSAWCLQQLRGRFASSVSDIKLEFRPEDINSPYYHYSHGLKKHAGQCQRIAHGHRSRLEIYTNGQLNQAAMSEWAARWQDIFIGSEEDLQSAAKNVDEGHLCFAYKAAQGYFELVLPEAQCYVINTDSTVELLAEHIANSVKVQNPTSHVKVVAYEGLGKGAIAVCE